MVVASKQAPCGGPSAVPSQASNQAYDGFPRIGLRADAPLNPLSRLYLCRHGHVHPSGLLCRTRFDLPVVAQPEVVVLRGRIGHS